MAFGQLVKNNFVSISQFNAKKIVDDDRNKYKKIWELLDDYCEKNEIIISDKNVILKVKKTKEKYNLYCMNPFKHALNIANMIHQNTSEKLIMMKTEKEHEEITIWINIRNVITVYSIERFKNLTTSQLINPIIYNKIFYMPPEIEIIEIYNDLYNPAKYGDWEKLLENEEPNIYNLVLERKALNIIGASEAPCKKLRREIIESFKIDIIQQYLYKKNNIVLIGFWAFELLKKGRAKVCAEQEKIEIISSKMPDEILDEIKLKFKPDFEITIKEQELHIPKDFRTKRYTFYANIITKNGRVEKPFLDLFNSTNFELIPYFIIDNIYVGNKFVLLRFLFIDLWIVGLAAKMGYFSDKALKEKIHKILDLINKVRGAESQIKNFLGTYRDYEIDKKINLLKTKKNNQYIPEKYLKDNGTYWYVGVEQPASIKEIKE